MKQHPYVSSQDSLLLREVIRGRSGDSCLEIGTGNAGGLIELSERYEIAAGTDLVAPASFDWRGGRGSFLLADAASCFRDECFDLVVFNPPYLPSETIEDLAVDGGVGGIEVPLHFLREAMRVVRKRGRILMLLSSENPLEQIRRECSAKGFEVQKVAEKRLFYEELYVFEAASKQPPWKRHHWTGS